MQTKVHDHQIMMKYTYILPYIALGFALGASLSIVLGSIGAFIVVNIFAALEAFLKRQADILVWLSWLAGSVLGICLSRFYA